MKINVTCYHCQKKETITKDYTEEHIKFLKNHYMCQNCYDKFIEEIKEHKLKEKKSSK